MDEILLKLCRNNTQIMDGGHPLPATYMSKVLGISVGKVRYHLKRLKEKGLVESVREGGMTEDGEVYCLHGWHITAKAKETAEYKRAVREERDLCMECFGFDCGIEAGEQNDKCETAEKHNGKCLGYQKSEQDDEPIEECEKCLLYDGLRE